MLRQRLRYLRPLPINKAPGYELSQQAVRQGLYPLTKFSIRFQPSNPAVDKGLFYGLKKLAATVQTPFFIVADNSFSGQES
jgi:hypothetical protein